MTLLKIVHYICRNLVSKLQSTQFSPLSWSTSSEKFQQNIVRNDLIHMSWHPNITNLFDNLACDFHITSTCLASWDESTPDHTSVICNIISFHPKLSPLPNSDQSHTQLHSSTTEFHIQSLKMWKTVTIRVDKMYVWNFQCGSTVILKIRYITWQIWLQ